MSARVEEAPFKGWTYMWATRRKRRETLHILCSSLHHIPRHIVQIMPVRPERSETSSETLSRR